MRTLVYYSKKPDKVEIVKVGSVSIVFIREKIKSYKHFDDDGNEKTGYQAYEYTTRVNSLNFQVTDEFIENVISKETEDMARQIREKRDALLAASDNEMLIDRLEHDAPDYIDAIKTYRQNLRDLPDQKGFPWDVVFPDKPKKE